MLIYYCLLNTVIVSHHYFSWSLLCYTLLSVLVLGIDIARGQYYWILDIGCLSWYRSNPIPIIKYYKNRCCYKATRAEQQCVLCSCSGVTWSHHLCRRHRYSYGHWGSFLSLVSPRIVILCEEYQELTPFLGYSHIFLIPDHTTKIGQQKTGPLIQCMCVCLDLSVYVSDCLSVCVFMSICLYLCVYL